MGFRTQCIYCLLLEHVRCRKYSLLYVYHILLFGEKWQSPFNRIELLVGNKYDLFSEKRRIAIMRS